jgi:SAM-dependent methyltransferase
MNSTSLLESRPAPSGQSALDMQSVKARQKATWESGDFGQVARFIMPLAEEFMSRLKLSPGMKLLDAACGTGNLAVIAARKGCQVSGLDIATNLIAQARDRAKSEKLTIDYSAGDAEAMPYPDASFDAVVSMYGVMFAPRPELVARELCRVTKPGGLIALANWTPQGFIGKMFAVFSRHLPPQVGLPSPLLWGDEPTVRNRLGMGISELQLTRCMAHMRFPFDSEATVNFFRRYYGPTLKAFKALDAGAQAALMSDLVELQARHNISPTSDQTDTPAEYLEVHARRAH